MLTALRHAKGMQIVRSCARHTPKIGRVARERPLLALDCCYSSGGDEVAHTNAVLHSHSLELLAIVACWSCLTSVWSACSVVRHTAVVVRHAAVHRRSAAASVRRVAAPHSGIRARRRRCGCCSHTTAAHPPPPLLLIVSSLSAPPCACGAAPATTAHYTTRSITVGAV